MSSYNTESELVDRYKYYIIQLESLIHRGESFIEMGVDLPISIHRNDINTLALLEYNDATLTNSGYSREEMDGLGAKFFLKHVHPYHIKVTARRVVDAIRKEPDKVVGFVEYMHLNANEDEYKPVLTFGKINKNEPKSTLMLSLIPQMFYNNKLPRRIEQIVAMDEFKFRHFKQFQQLTAREKQILKLLAQGLNNPKIADRLFISRQTVETHRKHINRKLGINHYRDLVQYAMAFDLITIR